MLHRKDIVFTKPSILQPGISSYASAHSTQPPELSRQVWQETRQRLPQWADIATSPLQVSFLSMLVSLLKARRILEVGTFTGHATVAMAERLPADGEIFTIDNFAADRQARAIATSAFSRSRHAKKIQLIEGDATTALQSISGPFDLIFVDADKPNYQRYFTTIVERDLLPRGGLLVFDNTLWGGRVLTPSDKPNGFEEVAEGAAWVDGMMSEWARYVVEFNRHLAEDKRIETVVLTVQDGMTLVRRTI